MKPGFATLLQINCCYSCGQPNQSNFSLSCLVSPLLFCAIWQGENEINYDISGNQGNSAAPSVDSFSHHNCSQPGISYWYSLWDCSSRPSSVFNTLKWKKKTQNILISVAQGINLNEDDVAKEMAVIGSLGILNLSFLSPWYSWESLQAHKLALKPKIDFIHLYREYPLKTLKDTLNVTWISSALTNGHGKWFFLEVSSSVITYNLAHAPRQNIELFFAEYSRDSCFL